MIRHAFLLAVAACAVGPRVASAQAGAEARTALRSGDYQRAIHDYRGILRGDPASVPARRGLIEALVVRGHYEEAEAAAREAPDAVALGASLGEVLVRRGDLDGAEIAFRRAVQGGADDRLTAEVDLAELLFRRGRVDEAMQRFDHFIDVYNGARGRLSARDLVAVGRAVHRLGRTNPDLFQDALRAFDEAAAADPGWAEPSVRAGDLLLEKYQSPEAQAAYEKVLAVNPHDPRALLGLARALEFDGTAGAGERIGAALEVNENDPDAHLLRARLSLSREDFGTGASEAEAALSVDPASLEALSVLAAARFLADDTAAYRDTRARALRLNPRYAGLDATVAEMAVRVRRYRDAVERAATAVALDSLSWRAWGLLGMNQLRLGRIDEGRASLERAFAGDPYNPWFKNSLDLLDTFDRYESRETGHFQLFLNRSEADLVGPYVASVAEEAYDSLAARYGVEPALPVRVELYPSHADFSVRTLGETGLGALGVTFGSVVVLDSPAARERGDYNWASTLWHELAHAFHLAMSANRVPRWFSEGLAVREQQRARPGWGHQASIPFLQALREGKLKKFSELDDGFMRPEYPEQVSFSYYEASLVFQLLEERHGFQAVRTMLDGYSEGRTTEELFTSVLGTTTRRFDDDFDAYMRERFASPLRGLARVGRMPSPDAGPDALAEFVRAHPGDLVAQMLLAALLVRDERYDEAEPHAREALRIFPDYGGRDSPLLLLARIARARGDLEGEAAELARVNAHSESNYDALIAEAEVRDSLGERTASAHALEKAIQVYPYDVGLHERLAVLHGELGDRFGAVRERQAVVALDPPDRAEALYRLAVAQLDAGSRDDARRSVLRALEIAPSYEDALELLLAIRREGPGGSADTIDDTTPSTT